MTYNIKKPRRFGSNFSFQLLPPKDMSKTVWGGSFAKDLAKIRANKIELPRGGHVTVFKMPRPPVHIGKRVRRGS